MDQKSREEKKKSIAEFGRQVLFHNVFIKLLSIIGAVLVWLMIVNIDDPYKTKSLAVRVETINESALRSVNKVYEVIDGNTAIVTVGGKRSVVDKLQSDDIRATADLSELSSVNAVAIKVGLKRTASSEVDLECSQVLKVSLEDMETKQVKVTVETMGTPADGYMVGECVARPNGIEVTGGSSVIDRIATVRVSINVNGASQGFSKRLEPAAYDKRGNRIISSTLSFSESTVRVKAKLLQSRMIPVSLQVSGKPADGYELTEARCFPEEIEVAGTEKQLQGLSKLVIPIDVTGLTDVSGGLEREVIVSEYLGGELTIPEEYQKVSVKISIEKLIRKEIQVQTTKIEMRDVPEGYAVTVYGNYGMLDLTFLGRASVLEGLSEKTISAFVDCSGLKGGIHTLPIEVEAEDGCKLVKRAKLQVLMTNTNPVDSGSTPEPDAEPDGDSSDDAAEEE